MPQHKSAIKRVRQNSKRREHNRELRAKMRSYYKKVLKSTDKEEAEKAFKEAAAFYDRMVVKGILHRNNAANKKSRLAKYVNNL